MEKGCVTYNNVMSKTNVKKNNEQEELKMAQITVIDKYEIEIQSRPAMNFIGQDGKPVSIEAQKERLAWVVLGEYDEFVVPFVLPATFDAKRITKGSILNVTCKDKELEILRPINIKNVNRVIDPSSKNK